MDTSSGMSKENISRSVKVELSNSLDDWVSVRECFVQSFRRYPLYKYIVPDDSKRDIFLRAYLDANYEVTVGSGQGILLAIKIPADVADLDANANVSDQKTRMKVVGGVVFVPPSSDGCGWAIGSDEPYWKAYEKYELAKISKEGLERVIRYEAWENEHVGQKASATRIPLWNGLFCAISPEYSSKGVGTTGYRECIRIMAKYSISKEKNILQASVSSGAATKRSKDDETDERDSFFGKLKRFLAAKQLHRFTLLNHRALPQGAIFEKLDHNNKAAADAPNRLTKTTKLPQIPQPPLLVAISQSDRAAHFHKSNGFQPVCRIPYHDDVDGTTPFYTHVLVLDPFRTGRMDEFGALMRPEPTDEPPHGQSRKNSVDLTTCT